MWTKKRGAPNGQPLLKISNFKGVPLEIETIPLYFALCGILELSSHILEVPRYETSALLPTFIHQHDQTEYGDI